MLPEGGILNGPVQCKRFIWPEPVAYAVNDDGPIYWRKTAHMANIASDEAPAEPDEVILVVEENECAPPHGWLRNGRGLWLPRQNLRRLRAWEIPRYLELRSDSSAFRTSSAYEAELMADSAWSRASMRAKLFEAKFRSRSSQGDD